MQNTQVIIIGAGASGLAAARYLKERAISCIVLEAQERIGGRIYTDRQFAGIPIELGAEYMETSQAYEKRYVEHLGLHTEPFANWSQSYYLHQGHPYRMFGFLCRNTQLFHVLKLFQIQNYDGPDISVAQFCKQAKIPQRAQEIMEWIFYSACASSRELSIYFVKQEMAMHDFESMRIVEGYSRIVEHLAQPIDIRLNEPVIAVQQNNNCINVYTQNKRSYSAAHVLVTVPLGVLKANMIQFTPCLPEANQRAIEAFRMNSIVKVLLKFKRCFWPHHLRILIGGSLVPVYWCTGRAPVITAFLTSDKADYLTRHGPNHAILQCVKELSCIYHCDAESLLENAQIIDWARTPFIRGGYSSISPGAYMLRHALYQSAGRVHFAGEHAIRTNTMKRGTVSGALMSGIEQARIISEYIRFH